MSIKVISPSKIKTENIAFEFPDKQSTKVLINSFDRFPYIYIKKIDDPIYKPPIDGTNIAPNDIIYVKLFNNKFLPEIELYCNDSKGILFNNLYPFDHDTLICLFIKANNEITYPIRMDFMITEFETIRTEGNFEYKFLMKGILNVDELHYCKFEAFNDTSFNLLKKIANKFNLGFATNVTSSNDKMKWINPANTYLKFIKDITKHSYISDDNFIWSFIDFYYNLNYVDIQKEIQEFNKEEKDFVYDPTIDSDKENETEVKHYLTNNPAVNMTNKYISKFNLVNHSFGTNLKKHYNTKTRWYNSDNFTIYDEKIKNLENEAEKSKLIQLEDKESDISKFNYTGEFYGKLDPDNCHEKYFYAKMLNEYNILGLDKMKMVIYLKLVNFDIKRFQNINIEIWNINETFTQEAENEKPLQNINKRLSGFWYVTGINYIYKRSGGVEQEITLMRRDLDEDYSKEVPKDIRDATK
jgi:hypothetical protein